MLTEGLVSIVVPIYNVEKYLDRCVESLIEQTYRNIEIILVDDGSPDNSPKMCDDWAKKDDRIRVIHKKNAGLGWARNSGLDMAEGEYVCFCDSDDYYSSDAVEICYTKASKHEAELLCFGFVLEGIDGGEQGRIGALKEEFFQRKEDVYNSFIPRMAGVNPDTRDTIGLWMSVSACFFSRRFLLRTAWRCRSERDVISEDMLSLLELYADAERILVVKETPYHYLYNPKSLSHTYRQDRFEKIKQFYHMCVRVCREKNYPDIVEREMSQQLLFNTIATLKQVSNSDTPLAEKIRILRSITADEDMRKVLNETKWDNFNLQKRILFAMMRARMATLIYLILKLKTMGGAKW